MSHAPSKQQHRVQTTTKNWKEESISTCLAAINLNKPIDKLLNNSKPIDKLPQPPSIKVNKHQINVYNALPWVRLSWNVQNQVSWLLITPI